MKSSKIQAPRSRKAPDGKAPNGAQANPSYGLPDSGFDPYVMHDASDAPAASRRPPELGERSAQFGEAIIRFVKRIPRDPANDRLIHQLTGCGTSVGANYCEANEAVSKKDFRNTIGRCLKEAKETKYFLRMVATAEPRLADEARKLYREAHELLLILSSMRRK